MGKAHKLTTSNKGKIKLGFKAVLFGEDEGVKDALAKLETRVSDVTQTEITVIVKDLGEAARNIRGVERKLDQAVDAQEKAASSLGQLQAAEGRRTDADKDKKESEILQKMLNVEDNKEPWQERQDELWRHHVRDTG